MSDKTTAPRCHACGLGYRCWDAACANTAPAPSPLNGPGPWPGEFGFMRVDAAELARLRAIESAAKSVCDAARKNHNTRPWPTKYGMPFGELADLEKALTDDL